MQTRDGRWVRTGPEVTPGPADTYIAYGRAWANVSNTPFREYKHWTHEGGISTPLIASWPAGIATERRGALETQPGHLIDLMATCVDLSGAPYPAQTGSDGIAPMEGVSLRPALLGKALERKAPLFWEHEGNRAIRERNWKLVGKENQPWELYDMSVDRAEMHDRAEAEPARVADLTAKWDAYAARAQVLPLGAWRRSANPTDKGLSKETRFDLPALASLGRHRAPPVAGRALRVEAIVEFDAHGRGVIVAQGGSAFGYALYLDEQTHPVFAVRNAGALTLVRGPKMSPGKRRIAAALSRTGEMTLSVDGTIVGTVRRDGPISKMPAEGLQTNEDRGGSVGEYTTSNPFSGRVEAVRIDVEMANPDGDGE